VCPACAEPYEPAPAELATLGLAGQTGRTFKRPRGCAACDGSGYRGRVALFELLELDAELRDATFRGEDLDRLRARARTSGRLQPLASSGARKVMAGTTSTAEVLRVVRLGAAQN